MLAFAMMHKYLDPKNDIAFKKIFGEEKNKEIPIDFLNSALSLEGKDRIIDLEFLNPVQPPEIAAKKESIVDVLVRDDNGFRYIIEMQVAKIPGFEKRAQYYAAKTYCTHFNSGGEYKELKKVVFLAITDYVLFPEKDDYKSMHLTIDTKTGENDLQDFSFTFVELPKFTKKEHELKTVEEKWYYFLKTAPEFNDVSEVLVAHSEIAQAYKILDRFNWTDQELMIYDRVIMANIDAKAKLRGAREEGLAEGIEKGEKKKAMEIAKSLLKEGLAISMVIKSTGLQKEEVEKLASAFATAGD
ncbi:MAG: Rpn family recombination-promoting nuclease/putative transposase [Candidatus Algichlamydia australiensis]|nr:Rpn family recombination-promoting nuclease/putative transposase [Chlamydiales bacterium]